MNEKQVEYLMSSLQRWMDNRIVQHQQGTVGEGFEQGEIDEAMENVAAALLGVNQSDLPESLQFTRPA